MRASDGYWGTLLLCRNGGKLVESRVGAARELLNVSFEVQPFALPRRQKMRRELGYMELCQLLTGAFELSEIERVAPRVDMSLFGRSAIYGPRVFDPPPSYYYGTGYSYSKRDQLDDTIEELRKSPNSRRALISITNSHEPLEDQPCVSSLQFQVRGNILHTSVYIRSWDLWFGAPHDLIVISGLSQIIASCVCKTPLAVGPISLFVANAHIYERSIDDAGGPALSWSFIVPSFSSIISYRDWAAAARSEVGWTHGAMPGLASEIFPKAPPLDGFKPTIAE